MVNSEATVTVPPDNPPGTHRSSTTEGSTALKASDKAAEMRKKIADEREQLKLAFLEELKSLGDAASFSQLPLYLRTRMFMEKPFKVKREGVNTEVFLSGTQALGIVMELAAMNRGAKDNPDLELTPYGEDIWIDPDNFKINVTVAGLRKFLGRRGDAGIPEKKVVTRPWPESLNPEVRSAIPPYFKQDLGVECSIPLGGNGPQRMVTRTAWLSGGWFKNTKNWREQPEHMLGVRAEGMCCEAVTGVGISQPHGNEDVEPPKAALAPPVIEATEFKAAPDPKHWEDTK